MWISCGAGVVAQQLWEEPSTQDASETMYTELLSKWRAKEAEEAKLQRQASPTGQRRKAKAGWCLPSGHGLDPKHDTLLRVRQKLNAAKRQRDYSWDQLFAYCDRDRSGTLDWKEFKHMVRKTLGVAHETVCDADLLVLFEQVDSGSSQGERNNLVDLSELLHYLARGQQDAAVLQARVQQRIQRVRRNIQLAFVKLDLTEADSRQLFERIDLDSSNRLSEYEFEVFVRERLMLSHWDIMPSDLHDFYKFLDRDGDGIDIFELLDYVRKINRIRDAVGARNLTVAEKGATRTRRRGLTYKDKLQQELEELARFASDDVIRQHWSREAWPLRGGVNDCDQAATECCRLQTRRCGSPTASSWVCGYASRLRSSDGQFFDEPVDKPSGATDEHLCILLDEESPTDLKGLPSQVNGGTGGNTATLCVAYSEPFLPRPRAVAFSAARPPCALAFPGWSARRRLAPVSRPSQAIPTPRSQPKSCRLHCVAESGSHSHSRLAIAGAPRNLGVATALMHFVNTLASPRIGLLATRAKPVERAPGPAHADAPDLGEVLGLAELSRLPSRTRRLWEEGVRKNKEQWEEKETEEVFGSTDGAAFVFSFPFPIFFAAGTAFVLTGYEDNGGGTKVPEWSFYQEVIVRTRLKLKRFFKRANRLADVEPALRRLRRALTEPGLAE
ncbi:23 kDa calcium-binding protein, partial [Symbiodinium microadriaticum]